MFNRLPQQEIFDTGILRFPETEVVSPSGWSAPVPRANFYKKNADGTKCGHYLWDERMSLRRQYTPAVVPEIPHLAATER